MSASSKFKIGEIVTLKSGGPSMTVNEWVSFQNGFLCQWFAGKKLEHGHFHPDSLKLVADEQKD